MTRTELERALADFPHDGPVTITGNGRHVARGAEVVAQGRAEERQLADLPTPAEGGDAVEVRRRERTHAAVGMARARAGRQAGTYRVRCVR